MLILNFVFGGDFNEGLLRLFICGIVAVIGGIAVAVLAAFPFMMGDEPNVPLYIKCACGGVMFVIAFFHFDIMLNLFDLLPAPLDRTGDPIIDMIGTEYESIADIDDM
ncbi:MAG: hypothetical protein IJB74_09620 [Clostridia bacterium]|nr:hypothetical protein [Clostridia bacterium]